MSDHYKALGVEKTASDAEIKKAYRALAKKYHPDKASGNEEKFKEISAAYETLGNSTKRQEYDSPSFGGGGGFSAGFNGFEDMFGSMFGGQRHAGPMPFSPDLELSIEITLAELCTGTSKRENIRRKVMCDPCRGIGFSTTTCSPCNGSGRMTQRMGNQIFQQTCRVCQGQGQVRDTKRGCKICKSRGFKIETVPHTFEIPKGAGHLTQQVTLSMSGMGHKVGTHRGQLHLHVRVRHQPSFTQEGLDLVYEQEAQLSELILGAQVEVELPSKKKIKISIPKGSSPYTSHRVKGKGLPAYNRPTRGDLIVKMNLQIPTDLTPDALDHIRRLQELGL